METAGTSRRKPKAKIVILGLFVAAILVVVLWFASPIIAIPLSIWHVHRIESKLERPEYYQPFAELLALYCQSDRTEFPDHLNYAWLPKEIDQLAPYAHARVQDDEAEVQMGGGFYHFGYHLTLIREESSGGTNKWALHRQVEDSDVKTLIVFDLPKTKKLTPDEIVEKVTQGYDRGIANGPNPAKAHQGKIQTFLRFGRVKEARRSCREFLDKMPGDWMANLLNSLLDAEEISFQAGESRMTRYASAQPSFFSYIDLAYFYQLLEKPAQSAAACLKALDYDANVPWGNGCNADCRAYTAAMYLYRAKEYNAARALCTKMLAVTINGNYAKEGFRKIISASEAAQKDSVGGPIWEDRVLPFDAFEDIDAAKLFGHALNRQTKESH